MRNISIISLVWLTSPATNSQLDLANSDDFLSPRSWGEIRKTRLETEYKSLFLKDSIHLL